MAKSDWQQTGRAWMHPDCQFFVVEQEVPEIASGGQSGLVEFHVMRGGGDDSASFSLSVFSALGAAIADAERRDEQERASA